MENSIDENIEYEKIFKIELSNEEAKEILKSTLNITEIRGAELYVVKQAIKQMLKENEELKIKNNAIKRESEAYAENMIRLDNELNLEKEKSKYEWIRQNYLSQELVNKLYIPVQKVKDKIEELKQYKISLLKEDYAKKQKNFTSQNVLVCSAIRDISASGKIEILQELLEERK